MTAEQLKRHDELWHKAVSYYLNKTDFDPSEWLDDGERQEFEYLHALEDGDEEWIEATEITWLEYLKKQEIDKGIKALVS